MKYLCTFIILTFNLGVLAAVTPPIDSPALQNSSYAFYAKYVDGEDIIGINQNLRLAPASTVKLFTTAAALEILGPDKTFKTRLYSDGKKNIFDTLKGNLYVVGGGDPALGSYLIKNNPGADDVLAAWTAAVKKAGIEKISGAVYADANYFEGLRTPRKFTFEDMGSYYGAAPEALNFNDNYFRIYFKPSAITNAVTDISRTEPEVPGIIIKNHVLTSDNPVDNAYVFNAPGSPYIEIFGTIPAVNREFSIRAALPNPPLFAAQSLVKTLAAQDIKTTDGAKMLENKTDYSGKILLYEQDSPPVSEIIKITNKKSFNLYAEVLLKHLAAAAGLRADTDSGTEAIKKFLQDNKIDPADTALYDGSGLSRVNYTTAKTMVSLLEFVSRQPYFETFYNSLINPSDNDKNYFTNAFAGTPALLNARIKTGTTLNARAYAGYVKDKQGKLIAFCFMANNFTAPTPEISAIFDKLVIQMSKLPAPVPAPAPAKVKAKAVPKKAK